MYEHEQAEYARDRDATPVSLASVGIGEALSDLITTFDRLETRLRPVLRQNEPVSEVARDRDLKSIETSSPHVVDLHRHQELIRELGLRMAHIIERLEV